MIVLLLASLGLAAPDAPAAPTATDIAAPVVPHDHDAFRLTQGETLDQGVQRALASRREIPCDQVLGLGEPSLVRAALISGTETELPPWAPLRAAACLTQLAESDDLALRHVTGLASRSDAPGFALVVTERLDALPESRAVPLAQAVLANPAPALQTRVPARLRNSSYASIRALAPSR